MCHYQPHAAFYHKMLWCQKDYQNHWTVGAGVRLELEIDEIGGDVASQNKDS